MRGEYSDCWKPRGTLRGFFFLEWLSNGVGPMKMRKCHLVCLMLAQVLVLTSQAADVVVLQGPGSASNEVQVACDFVEQTFGVNVRRADESSSSQENGPVALWGASLALVKDAAVTVKFVRVDSRDSDFRQSVYTGNVAVINLSGIVPPAGDGSALTVLGRQRMQRLAAYAVGRVLGLPPCPTIYCAMYPSGTAEEFDAKAINLCPPCLHNAMAELRGHGVKVADPFRRRK